MYRSTMRMAVCILLLWFSVSAAFAGTFTPDEGTTINSTSVTVGWASDAKEQWVRAYDSSGGKLYDSGRQKSSTGSSTFSIGMDLSQLKIIFYEKNNTGHWTPDERMYMVNIGVDEGDGTNGGNGSTTEDTLSGLNCANDQVAKYNGSAWQCATDENTDTLSDLNCGADQIAVSDSSGNWSCAAAPSIPGDEDVVAVIESLFCRAGEELHRSPNGDLSCGVVCPYEEELTTAGLTSAGRDPQGNGFYVDDDFPGRCSVVNDALLSGASLSYNSSSVPSLPETWALSIFVPAFEDNFEDGFDDNTEEVDIDAQLSSQEAAACAILMECSTLFDPIPATD